ncbi:hypothetical protein BLA29_006315 [Euroglyphus maynei]|uniref:Uncharacterized protein n=1 Tax=Euroglyphus maynei TaxID=6958 RepID=A0A1Y3ASF3_EURMA|nr:hypothetical protein BLA29_006315 [Euroglyphus maynei]
MNKGEYNVHHVEMTRILFVCNYIAVQYIHMDFWPTNEFGFIRSVPVDDFDVIVDDVCTADKSDDILDDLLAIE